MVVVAQANDDVWSSMMKRDMEIIRKLLLQIEAHEGARPIVFYAGEQAKRGDGTMVPNPLSASEREKLKYHLGLLVNAELVRVTGVRTWGKIVVHGLSWRGHDFVDAIRQESVWSKVKQKLAGVGGAVSLDIISDLAIQVTRDQLGLA